MQDEQRPLEAIDVRDGRSLGVHLRILLRSTDTARRPSAVIGVFVVHRVIDDTRHVDAGAKQLRLIRNSDKREEPAVAQTPDADAIHIDVAERLEIVRRHPRVFRVLAPNVHVDARAPLAAIPDAAAVVGRDHHIPFLKQKLMKAVVDRVVTLHVPAVIVLVDAIAVDGKGRVFISDVKGIQVFDADGRYLIKGK